MSDIISRHETSCDYEIIKVQITRFLIGNERRN